MSAPIALCVIARNEQQNLPRCLLSVRSVVSEMVVVDTGSTDDTAAIARAMGARVVMHAWQDDFSAARNAGLAAVTAPWVLLLDADEELCGEDAALLARLPEALGDAEGCFLRIISFLGASPGPEQTHDARLSLFRNRPAYRFSGRIHEQILPAIVAAQPGARLAAANVRILHYGYLATVLEQGKRQRNLRLLAGALAAEPAEPFWQYALATEHLGMEAYAEALARLEAAAAGWSPDEPRHADLLRKQVICLSELGRDREALSVAEAALARHPDYTDLAFLAGAAAQRAQEFPAAREWFRRCLQMGDAPWHYQTCHGIGSFRAHAALAAAADAPAEAAEHFLAALQVASDWRPAQLGLAQALAAWPPDDAAAWVARRMDVSDPSTLLALGTALLQAGAVPLIERLTQELATPAHYVLAAAVCRRRAGIIRK